MLKGYFHKLLNHPVLKIGITKASSLDEEKKVYLVNIISVLILISFSIVMLIGVFFDPRLIIYKSLIGHLVPTILVGVVFCLQHWGLHHWAKVLVILITLITCFVFDIYILPEAHIRIYAVFLPIVPLCIFNNKWVSIGYLLLCWALFLDLFHFKDGVDYNQLHFSILFLVIFFSVYFLTELNKRAEKKLQNQQKELKVLNEFKSHFFVNLSHEIRTPLTIIKGYFSRLNLDISNDDYNKKVKIIEEQINHIQNIVDNILDLSRLDANKLELNFESIDLIPFIKKHYSDYKELFLQKNIQYDLKLDLPETKVKMDISLFSKALNNLLDNALKFTSKNGLVIIEVSYKSVLTISIIDNGIGIPTYDLENISSRFFQSKNHITKSQGSGIGLSFSKSIMEAHGFKLLFSSIPNVRTCFSISIPKKAISANNGNTQTSKNYSVDSLSYERDNTLIPHLTNKKHILIVDDHTAMRDYLKNVLNIYHISEAENGKEALSIIKNCSLDAIVTDFMMPVMDGISLVSKIKELNIKIPIIVITARRDNEGKLNMLRMGIDAYFTKPFMEEELLIDIKRAISFYDTIKDFETQLTAKDKIQLTSHENEFHTQLTTFIEQNICNKNFGVENIAFHMNLSRTSLHRKTKLLLGQTPNEIMMEIRLQKAKNILKNTPNIKKKDLAEAVGVHNASYFYKKLEQRFGVEILR